MMTTPSRPGGGHQRRPSIGKSMPISALILDTNPMGRRKYIEGSDAVPRLILPSDHDDNDDDHQLQQHEDNDSMMREMQEKFDINDFRAKLKVAEALSKASMLTSPAAKRRLAARKVEMDTFSAMDHNGEQQQRQKPGITGDSDCGTYDYVPPRDLLIYLVRMGSFNSAPKINNVDSQDDDIIVPDKLSIPDFIHHCKMMRGEQRPQLLDRLFLKPPHSGILATDLTDGMRVLSLDTVSKTCSAPGSPKHIRLLQWNILSQSLGQHTDGFVNCPDEALTWECRKYQILQEIIQTDPDVVCLQEVDHFKFLQGMLRTQDYEGVFYPKPDSPCLYIKENNGPDGCAIFYKRSKFEMVHCRTRVLEVWRVQSNQVAVAAVLRVRQTGEEFCVATTHLKARHGALLSKLRNEQGKDLMRFTKEVAEGRPLLLAGDFNAEPTEPVYSTIINYKGLGLGSAYADLEVRPHDSDAAAAAEVAAENKAEEADNGEGQRTRAEVSASREPKYTTWKIREDGEVCHCIDYVFYTADKMTVTNCLTFPQDVGKNRVPGFHYPSDHFSLVCDFELVAPAEGGGDKEVPAAAADTN